ncbi:sensor histidine kinase [Williamsia phyllosphaerae]|uniref:histidine kinase n=1 Tax=Williamsia phyllosphaerae TaxID=885042 RepID=A0ABQ1UEB2_9NOCA|nr:histidine kinase [Williamsia phyllosphaerae]GGF15724.1 two-component sensor histidine kinase [Williamsia phyllosphaerae]
MRVPNLSRLAPPVPADGHQGAGITDATMMRLLPLINVVVVVWAWFTVSPLGLSGSGLYGLILMIVGSMAMSLRLLPSDLLSFRQGFVATLVGAVVAGLLFGFDPSSAATAFAPIIAGTAGFRFTPVPAITIAAVTSATAFLATVVRYDGIPYWALMVGLAVLIGMTRRDRSEALRLAREKVEQTERAVASESRAQVLAERARVAREIHDVLAHSLSGVNMQLNLADALLEDGRTDAGREAVAVAQTLVTDGLVEARKAVYALRDERRDLVATIESMSLGETETVTVTGRPRAIDSRTSGHLERIVGEALTNARRHAPGAPTAVTVVFGADLLTIEVVNSTTGDQVFDDGAGVGVTGMRERAAEIGARLTAGGDGRSWTVQVEVDL